MHFFWNWNLIFVCSFLASQWRYWNIWERLTVLIIAGSAVWREQSGQHVSRKHGQLRWSAEIQKRYTTTEAFVEDHKETGESASKHLKIPCCFLYHWIIFLAIIFLLKFKKKKVYKGILKTKYVKFNFLSNFQLISLEKIGFCF